MSDYVDIIGYEKLYAINKEGSVWSYKHKKFKTHLPHKGGYKQVHLYNNSKCKVFYIHRLIAIHFIPNPYNYTDIDHINNIRDDNRIENLRWITKRNNNNNRTLRPQSNEPYIHISSSNNYRVSIRPHYDKTFKKLEEAIIARDNTLIKFNLQLV